MKRRIVSVLAVLAMSLGIGLVVASPAQAAWSNCVSSGGVVSGCMWQDKDGGGAWRNVYWGDFSCINMPAAWNDTISSIKNISIFNNPKTIIIYKDANCSTSAMYEYIYQGEQVSFGPLDRYQYWNDKISSYKIVNG